MRKRFSLYPFLFALSPALFLFSQNITRVLFSDLIFPLLFLFGLVFVLLLLTSLSIKGREKSALVTTVLVVFFFSYGHVYSFLNTYILIRHRLLIPIIGMFIAACMFCIRRIWEKSENDKRLLEGSKLLAKSSGMPSR